MKRFVTILLSAVLILCLAGCANRNAITPLEAETVLETEAVIVTQQGRTTTVTDRTSGEVYNFTLTRRKKPQNAAEAQQRMIARTAVDTDSLTIEVVHDLLIVTEKQSESIYYIKVP